MEEKRAILYLRVSTAQQAEEGCSLDAQGERLLGYAAGAGLTVGEVLREEGVSGTIPLASRPGGARVVEAVSSGRVKHVVALKLDRLFRSAVDALTVTEDWDRRGVALHLADHGGQSLNTGSAMGRMLLTMLAGFAQFERDLTSERTRAALRHKRDSGKVFGPVPYGMTREGDDLFIEPKEWDVLEEMREWREAGATFREIATRLNAAGISSKRGGPWHASSVRSVLGGRYI